jgi:hypothetical protein
MADLHPAAQVALIIGITTIACVFWLTVATDFFDNIGRK